MKTNVIASSVAKSLAFSINGIILGGMDWEIAFWSMFTANAACLVVLSAERMSATQIWVGWCAYYVSQAIVGSARYMSKTGVWNTLKGE